MPMLFDNPSLLAPSIFVLKQYDVLAHLAHEISSPLNSFLHAPSSPAFWLTLLGVLVAWLSYIIFPAIPAIIVRLFAPLHQLLLNKYGFDAFNDWFFVRGSLNLGQFFYQVIDQKIIDGFFVNGFARVMGGFAAAARLLQSGYLYHYVGFMVLGLLGFLSWFILS